MFSRSVFLSGENQIGQTLWRRAGECDILVTMQRKDFRVMLKRRVFLGRVAAFGAFSIVPARVLRGETAPSNQLTRALIGFGSIAHSANHLPFKGSRLIGLCDPYVARVKAGLAAAEKLLAEGKGDLPDLVYFTDDYLAAGALISFARHGVRFPEDVRFVSLATKGFEPVWWQELTRLEWDWAAQGEELARRIAEFLDAKTARVDAKMSPTYIIGDTFPKELGRALGIETVGVKEEK